MGDHLLGTARSVRHTAVERKDLEPVIVTPADERVKPPAQPVDLDDVPSPDPFEPHREQGYAGAMTVPSGGDDSPAGTPAEATLPETAKYTDVPLGPVYGGVV